MQAVPISAENERGVHSPLVNPDAQIIRGAIDLHNQTLRQIREPLGKTDTALQSYFALVRPDATLTVVANAQAATAKAALAKTAYGDLPLFLRPRLFVLVAVLDRPTTSIFLQAHF